MSRQYAEDVGCVYEKHRGEWLAMKANIPESDYNESDGSVWVSNKEAATTPTLRAALLLAQTALGGMDMLHCAGYLLAEGYNDAWHYAKERIDAALKLAEHIKKEFGEGEE